MQAMTTSSSSASTAVPSDGRSFDNLYAHDFARIAVGIQGVALGDAAYQKALQYSQERRQGREVGGDSKEPAFIEALEPTHCLRLPDERYDHWREEDLDHVAMRWIDLIRFVLQRS